MSATPSTLIDLLRHRAQEQPERTAFTFLNDGEDDQTSLTYGELDRRARAVAARLQDLGVDGERALLLYPAGLDYIAAFFGCLYAGSVAVPAYPPHPARLERTLPRLQTIARNARPAVALTTSRMLTLAGKAFDATPEFRDMEMLATGDGDTTAASAWRQPPVSPDSVAILQYTSGSTAAPKGVILSHSNVLRNSHLIHTAFGYSSSSVGVAWLPPYHDMGLIGCILSPLYCGFPVVLMAPANFLQRPYRWLKAISRFEATTSGGPNFAYDLCARRVSDEQKATLDLSSWELAFNGSEPVHHGAMKAFAESFADCGFRAAAFNPCYGLAESTLMVTASSTTEPPVVRDFQRPALEQGRVAAAGEGAAGEGAAGENHAGDSDGARTLVGCGRVEHDVRVLIVDPDSRTPCPADRVGEIWVAGPSIGQGYWNQAEESEHTFRAEIADTGEGPFLRTGDLGFLADGELFITGRIKDLIIIDGSNHYPQDIERTVENSHPALRINGCAAFPVDTDGREQLAIAAEIAPRHLPRRRPPGSRRDGAPGPGLESVVTAVRKAVAEHHNLRVRHVALLRAGAMPKTSSGKIRRRDCRAAFLAETLDLVETGA